MCSLLIMKSKIKNNIYFLSKSSLVKGTIFLTITGIVSKVLGLYNRIFLTRTIGVSEIGVYQLTFPIYIMTFSICVQGLTTTLTKHVAKLKAKERIIETKNLLYKFIFLALALSIATLILIRFNAYYISKNILKNTSCQNVLCILICAIPAMCIKALINSYFLGLNKPIYSGLTVLSEQIARIISLYFFSNMFFSINCHIVPNASLAAITSVLGEYVALIFSLLFFIHNNKTYNKEKYTIDYEDKIKTSDILSDYIPIEINVILTTAFSSLDAVLLPQMLYRFYTDSNYVMELYGALTGVCIPFILFPATITTALASIQLGSITKLYVKGNIKAIKKELEITIALCIFLGFSSLFLYFYGGEVLCETIFKNKTSGTLLKSMSICCPIIYTVNSLHTFLIGLNFTVQNLLYYIISMSIRITCTILLVPKFGIMAYIAGLFISNIVELILISNKLNIILRNRVIP